MTTTTIDGHANCFIESGDGKALLIDFNYDTEPLTGTYPLPYAGPLGPGRRAELRAGRQAHAAVEEARQRVRRR